MDEKLDHLSYALMVILARTSLFITYLLAGFVVILITGIPDGYGNAEATSILSSWGIIPWAYGWLLVPPDVLIFLYLLCLVWLTSSCARSDRLAVRLIPFFIHAVGIPIAFGSIVDKVNYGTIETSGFGNGQSLVAGLIVTGYLLCDAWLAKAKLTESQHYMATRRINCSP